MNAKNHDKERVSGFLIHVHVHVVLLHGFLIHVHVHVVLLHVLGSHVTELHVLGSHVTELHVHVHVVLLHVLGSQILSPCRDFQIAISRRFSSKKNPGTFDIRRAENTHNIGRMYMYEHAGCLIVITD